MTSLKPQKLPSQTPMTKEINQIAKRAAQIALIKMMAKVRRQGSQGVWAQVRRLWQNPWKFNTEVSRKGASTHLRWRTSRWFRLLRSRSNRIGRDWRKQVVRINKAFSCIPTLKYLPLEILGLKRLNHLAGIKKSIRNIRQPSTMLMRSGTLDLQIMWCRWLT